MHVDLGQGMLQVIEEVEQNLKDEKVNKKSNVDILLIEFNNFITDIFFDFFLRRWKVNFINKVKSQH